MAHTVPHAPKDNLLFWLLFIAICVTCYGGFTYVYSKASPPPSAELILKSRE